MWVYALSIAVAFVMAMVLTVLFGYRTPSRATKTQMVSADENARPQDMARGIDTTVVGCGVCGRFPIAACLRSDS